MPLERNASATIDPTRVSGGDSVQGPSARSANSIFRRRLNLFVNPATTKRRSWNKTSTSSPYIKNLGRNAAKNEVNFSIAQIAVLLRKRRRVDDVNCQPRISAAKSFEYCWKETGDNGLVASDTHLPGGGIGEEIHFFYALTQLVENGHAAIEQRASVLGGFNSTPTAIEKRYTKCMFECRDRSRNCGLGGVQALAALPMLPV